MFHWAELTTQPLWDSLKIMTKNDNEDLEDYAYRYIIHRIVENQVKPGDTILETEMAEILNVSRTPVRHALGRLVNEGLLEKKRKKGCIVPTPQPDDARQVFQAREILESKVAWLAALNRKDEDVTELRQILNQEINALDLQEKDGYYLSNENFHFKLIKSAGNSYFERYCRHLFRRSSFYIFYFDSFYSTGKKIKRLPRQLTPNQHLEIVDAIERRDPELAEKRMKEHVHYSFKVLLGL